jgi:hypothetical protein
LKIARPSRPDAPVTRTVLMAVDIVSRGDLA